MTGPAGAVFPSTGAGITDNQFCPWIPLDRTIQSLGDSGELTDGRSAMPDHCIANRTATRPHAFQPILLMIAGLIEADIIGRKRALGQFRTRRIEPIAPAYPNISIRADEANHVPVVDGSIAHDLDAVGILVVLILFAFVTLRHEQRRPGVVPAESPLGDVVVVGPQSPFLREPYSQ